MNRPMFHRFLLTAGIAFSLNSCIEIEQHIVLNPEGSGKVRMASAIAMPDFGALAGGIDAAAKADPKKAARELAIAMLRSEGIEAWSDVKYEIGKDGKTRASATGYFPDVTKVKLNNQIGDDERKQTLGIKKDSAGNWVFEQSDFLKGKKKDNEDSNAADKDDNDSRSNGGEQKNEVNGAEKAGKTQNKSDSNTEPVEKGSDSKPEQASKLTEEEVETKLIQERQQWAGMKAFMGAIFESMKARFSIEGGGTIVSTAVFKKESESKASFQFEGKDIIAMIDRLLQDDEKAKKMIREGKSPTGGAGGPEEGFSALFGEGTPRVVMKPGAPAFDYKVEVAKVKASQPPELKALLHDAKQPAKKSSTISPLEIPGANRDDGEKPAPKGKVYRSSGARQID